MLHAVKPWDDHELATLVTESDTLSLCLCTLLFDLEFSFHTAYTAWRADVTCCDYGLCGKNAMCRWETSGIQVGCGQTRESAPIYLQAFCTTRNVYMSV